MSCSSLWGKRLPSRQRRDMLESLRTVGGTPTKLIQFSSSLRTLRFWHWDTDSGMTLIRFRFKLTSMALITSIPTGIDVIWFDDKSTKLTWVSWQRKRGKDVRLFSERLTVLRALKFTKLSGKDDKLLADKFNVSSFFSSDNSLGNDPIKSRSY